MNAQGKVALVTGAGSGIGKAVAMAFLQEGYSVTLAGRRQERLGQAVSEAGVSEKQALIVPTDVRDPAAVRALFAKTKETFGRLDVLFNNAGIAAGGCSKTSATSSGKRWWRPTSRVRSCAPRKRSKS